MWDKLKKHSVKIFVFTINILLAAVAVFAIREKDQARLLEKVQNEGNGSGGENLQSADLPSFEGSISAEDQQKANSAESSLGQPEAPASAGPAGSENVAPAQPTPPKTPSVSPAPAPAKKSKPANAKTKTS